ncbi:MAG: cobalt ECF transporter T component CbiQ [Anaerolineaceae bacterium]|nr:cobalt ECF transporter T component CbiQ [Anaerolineaceae bacterium]
MPETDECQKRTIWDCEPHTSLILDPYQPGNSALHQLSARTKLLLTLGYILTTTTMPETAWRVYPILLVIILSTAYLAGVRLTRLIKRSLFVSPFLLAALPILFMLPGEPLWTIPAGSFVLTVTRPGVERFLSIGIKIWLCVQAAGLLTAVTAMPALLAALRGLRAPKILVAVAALMWRYLFVIADEAARLMRARSARSTQLPEHRSGGTLAWRAKVAGGMAGSLFLRSLERSENVFHAMQARGYDGESRSLPEKKETKERALALGVGGFLFLCLLWLGILWS